MFFAQFIVTWISKRNKFHFLANLNLNNDGRQRKKKDYFIPQMDRHHCHLLPHPIWEREGDGPPAKSHPDSWIYLIKCFTHLSS
jgi:hypothetical protein